MPRESEPDTAAHIDRANARVVDTRTMKTQFSVFSTCDLSDGTVLLAGHVTGPLLVPRQRGRGNSVFGEVGIEVVSLGLTDPLLDKSNVQTLNARVVQGESVWLNGTTLDFE